jgi:hypothetical protein
MLGVTLSFLPAREISDRFGRRGSGDSDDPAAAEQSSDTVDVESTGEGLSETE